MSPRKKTAAKATGAKPSSSAQQTVKAKIVRAIYDDTSRLLEKNGETLKWGEVYYMFKKSNFSTEAEELNELQASRISENHESSGWQHIQRSSLAQTPFCGF